MAGTSEQLLLGFKLARRRDLKIIFTSGYTNDAILNQTGLGGASAFLQKPFTPALLGQTVRDVLDTTAA